MQEPDPLLKMAEVMGRQVALQEEAANRDERIEKNLLAFRLEVKEDNQKRNGRIGSIERWILAIKAVGAALLVASPLFILGIRESIADLFK